jgi:hypothetical protein
MAFSITVSRLASFQLLKNLMELVTSLAGQPGGLSLRRLRGRTRRATTLRLEPEPLRISPSDSESVTGAISHRASGTVRRAGRQGQAGPGGSGRRRRPRRWRPGPGRHAVLDGHDIGYLPDIGTPDIGIVPISGTVHTRYRDIMAGIMSHRGPGRDAGRVTQPECR